MKEFLDQNGKSKIMNKRKIRTFGEFLNVIDRKNCNHQGDVNERTFMKNGIERKGLYCSICGYLLDYMPQYNED